MWFLVRVFLFLILEVLIDLLIVRVVRTATRLLLPVLLFLVWTGVVLLACAIVHRALYSP